jgi:RNA polymerase primary sigma factor
MKALQKSSFKSKPNDTLSIYLSTVDSGALLTKAQEQDLIKKVEVYQNEILTQFVLNKYSRYELYTYLSYLASHDSDITDISKNLDDESSSELVTETTLKLQSLIVALNNESISAETLVSLTNEFSLSGTILNKVFIEVQKKWLIATEFESSYRQIAKYLNINMSITEIDALLNSGKSECLTTLQDSFGFSNLAAFNKFNEWCTLKANFAKFLESVPGMSLKDIKDIYTIIAPLEVQSSKVKNELIFKNTRLVVSRARKFRDKGLDLEDLIQEGNIGLIKAINKFDSSKKTKISTYATWWIDQTIRRGISNKAKTVRVPTHIEWAETKINQAVHRLVGMLHRPPTLEEISKETNVSVEMLQDLRNRAQHEVGLEDELASGLSLLEVLPDDPDQSPYNLVEQNNTREKIRIALSTLTPKEEKIIRLRFGIGEAQDDGLTLQAIGDDFGVTKQAIRVRECKALGKLQRQLKDGFCD